MRVSSTSHCVHISRKDFIDAHMGDSPETAEGPMDQAEEAKSTPEAEAAAVVEVMKIGWAEI